MSGSVVFRLSIIIPATHGQTVFGQDNSQALEETLVSVLEHRPAHAEVLLACDDNDFSDPYGLDGEVAFVTAETEDGRPNSWMRLVNQALTQARGRFVHVLAPGALATTDWHKSACDYLNRFPQNVVGVSPRTTHRNGRDDTCGIVLARSGVRETVSNESVIDLPENSVFGPCRDAGFYRRAELIQAGGWNESVHKDVADLELIVRLRSAGLDLAHCDECVVDSAHPTPLQNDYVMARDSERIFRAAIRARLVGRRGIPSLLRVFASGGSLMGRAAGRFGDLPATTLTVPTTESRMAA